MRTKTKLTREEYESICSERGFEALGDEDDDWSEEDVWERWEYNAAAGSVEERKIHLARQRGFFAEESVKEKK